MPRKILNEELQPILDLIARHPSGIGIERLLKDIVPALPRRTLQRRLASLVAQRRVQTTGEGRALKYRLAVAPTLAEFKTIHPGNAIRFELRPSELLARIRLLLHSVSASGHGTVLRLANLELDLLGPRAIRAGRRIASTIHRRHNTVAQNR